MKGRASGFEGKSFSNIIGRRGIILKEGIDTSASEKGPDDLILT